MTAAEQQDYNAALWRSLFGDYDPAAGARPFEFGDVRPNAVREQHSTAEKWTLAT